MQIKRIIYNGCFSTEVIMKLFQIKTMINTLFKWNWYLKIFIIINSMHYRTVIKRKLQNMIYGTKRDLKDPGN